MRTILMGRTHKGNHPCKVSSISTASMSRNERKADSELPSSFSVLCTLGMRAVHKPGAQNPLTGKGATAILAPFTGEGLITQTAVWYLVLRPGISWQ